MLHYYVRIVKHRIVRRAELGRLALSDKLTKCRKRQMFIFITAPLSTIKRELTAIIVNPTKASPSTLLRHSHTSHTEKDAVGTPTNGACASDARHLAGLQQIITFL
jgi:hypothetical protein